MTLHLLIGSRHRTRCVAPSTTADYSAPRSDMYRYRRPNSRKYRPSRSTYLCVQCGGEGSGGDDDGDEVFLLELLACFCEEGSPRLQKLLGAALAHRDGQAIVHQDKGPDRPVALVIKEEAHALKGSAANLRLWRLAKV